MSLNLNQEQKGVVALIALTFLYGLYGIFSRYIGLEFATFSQNFVKNIFLSIIAGVIVVAVGTWINIRKKDIPLIFCWGFIGFISIITTFISYNHESIATMLLIFYVASIVTNYFIGGILFHEKMTKWKYLSLIFGAVGLIIVSSNNISFSQPYYLIVSFISGSTAALWYSFSKVLSHRYPFHQLIFLDGMLNLIFSFVAVIVLKESLPQFSFSISWIMVFLYAIAQLLGGFLSLYGYKKLEVQKAALITPMDIVFSSIFAFLIFSEKVSLTTFIGGIFIIIALVLPNLFWESKKK